jgi:outer membrane lipopolysaccharide assembly protein LptE/RlpB
MRRFLTIAVLLALAAVVSACGYGPNYGNSNQPMMKTGAPCGWHAVDAGICPKFGYKVAPGKHY